MMTQGEVEVGGGVKEKCGLYRDLEPLNCVTRVTDLEKSGAVFDEDGSELNGDGAAVEKRGFVLRRENGETAVVPEDVNEEEIGNGVLLSISDGIVNRGCCVDHRVDGSLQEDDATVGKLVDKVVVPNGIVHGGVIEGLEEKGVLENGIGNIGDEVKRELCLLANSDTSFSSVENQGMRVDTLVPLVGSVEKVGLSDISMQENCSIIVIRECDSATDLCCYEILGSGQEPDEDIVEVVSCSKSPSGSLEKNGCQSGAASLATDPGELDGISPLINGSNDGCVGQGIHINLGEVQTVGKSPGSPRMLAEVFENEPKDRKAHEGVEFVGQAKRNSGQEEEVEANVSKTDASIGSALNQESSVENSELAAESRESGEKDTFLTLGNVNLQLVDQINLDEAGQVSQGAVLDVAENGLKHKEVNSIVNFAGDVVEKVAHDDNVKHLRELECSAHSVGIQETRVVASEVADEARKIVESHSFLSYAGDRSNNGDCKWVDRVKSGTPEASDSCKGSPVVAEANFARELQGTADPASESLDVDSVCHAKNERESRIEEVTVSSSPYPRENEQHDDLEVSKTVENMPTQMHEAKLLLGNTTGDKEAIVQKKQDHYLIYNGDGDAERHGEPVTHLKGGAISFGTVESVIMIKSPVQSLIIPVSNGHVPHCEAESVLDGSKPENSGDGLLGVNTPVRWSSSEANIESDTKRNGFAEPSSSNPLSYEKLKEDFPTIHESYLQAGSAVKTDRCTNISRATSHLNLKPEIHIQNIAFFSNCVKTGYVHSLTCDGEGTVELKLEETEVKGDEVEDSARSCNCKTPLHVNEITHNYGALDSAPEDDTRDLRNVEARMGTKTKPFNFLVRIPRSDNDSSREQIRLAKLHVDEKTKIRDAIQDHIQQKRANSQVHATEYEYAKAEARNARKLVRLKRIEIDSLNSVINKAKNAMSIEDIDIQIRKMENMIQHETLPLKEEKLLIREIKQLKQLREQLSSSLGSQDEINQALEQREDVEERLKILRKELDILKDSVLKAEEAAIEAGKRYENENKNVKELRSQFRDADDVRQAAYSHLQSLRRDLWIKNKFFFKYKDDAAVATNYAFSGNTAAVYRLCLDQVESFMEMWNLNDEFRREYTQFNARSTSRRFGTLDGRTLGPDEKPTLMFSNADDGVNRIISKPVKADLRSVNSVSDSSEAATSITVVSDGGFTKKVAEHKYQTLDRASVLIEDDRRSEANDHVHEELDINMSRGQDEEKRMEEAELKEQRRLEELAKANEASERKRRQLEKLQMRAELKTQKEAIQREKEREKRLRKKERKKAAAASDNSDNCETSLSSDKAVLELTKEIETKNSCVTARKPNKPWLFSKYTKTKSVPPALRNRNKKKWQQWMWVGATCLFTLVLFWLGNAGSFTTVNLKRRNPVY